MIIIERGKSMRIFTFCLVIFLNSLNLAQAPSEPFHPMTANGARHIYCNNNTSFSHTLFWKNNSDVMYNEVYFSADSNLIANLNSSVKILSGADSNIVYNSMPLSLIGVLNIHTKYYWRVVQFNSFGSTAGPVWHFISQGPIVNYWEDDFSTGLVNYTIQTQGGNWSISETNNAGGTSPELRFYNEPGFNGISYLILNKFFDLSPTSNAMGINYGVDWNSGEFTIGIAYSIDEGNTWTPCWQQIITGDTPASHIWITDIPNENYVKLALFCSSLEPNSSGYWYLDNLSLDSPLTVSTPPARLYAYADSLSLSVTLSWSPGYTVNPSWGYVIEKKNGLPASSSAYQQIAWVGPSIFSFDDTSVELDSTYTYRIQSREGPEGGFKSTWGNEATAYVPEVVPVELTSFTASVSGSNVTLNWSTASEKNNLGFEAQRQVGSQQSAVGNEDWETIGFVEGKGTTTEISNYSFNDNLNHTHNHTLSYRLKQIDFDGSFEYSSIIEVELGLPTQFILGQNYPNPFNPVTTISWQAPVASHQVLKVFDILGNEVAKLIDEYRSAGVYEVEFDASTLNSGVYIYRLTTNNFTSTKKMILLK